MNNKGMNRRDFLTTTGLAGLGSILAAVAGRAEDVNSVKQKTSDVNESSLKLQLPQVPKRKLGKTGVKVPILCLGGMFDIPDNQIILRKAIDWGVTCWDTANAYNGGKSETGIGLFLKNKPKMRKKLFIVTKASGANTVDEIEQRLQTSLERMNTNYIDLYYGVHGMDDPAKLTDELKAWAKSAKERKLIKFFGFSTHTNMEKCIARAAELDWIDAIMTTYNFRQMQRPEMLSAIEAAHKAGIGLIAMKTQAAGQEFNTEDDKKLASRFLEKGFTSHQVNLKVVWQDERIATICSQMPGLAVLVPNVAAALDKTKLASSDIQFLQEVARNTCNGYCAGCAEICASATPDMPYISEVMRYLMYYNSYGQKNRARELFAALPVDIRKNITSFDYSAAQSRCPQSMPIAKLMKDAARILA